MAETDFTNIYRQFFEEFAKTVKLEDPLPIRVPDYNLERDEVTGEVIESCIQYLTLQKCPSSLLVPLITIALEEIQRGLKKYPENVDNPLMVMQMSTTKINDICFRYRDNEKLSSLPPPVKEQCVSQHGVKHRRRQMEDRYVCLPRFNTLYDIQSSGEASYYGLFDGHRGAAAASFAVSHLHQFLAESQYYPQDPVSALREAYQKTDSRYSRKNLSGGTTASVILHQHEEKKLIVSWVGDSQAMLVKQEGYLMLIDPHRPDRKDECKRIYQLGGFVATVLGFCRVNGQLAVSRAIGDGQWKPFVSAEPEIRVVGLTGSEEFLVIGSDGLWDVVEPTEVIKAVYSKIKENPDNTESVSRQLVDLAKKNNSTDNISVIVVFFADPVEISKRSVEAIGPGPNNVSEGEMNTNFQAAAENSPLVQLSDPGMNMIYEENGAQTEYMLQSKEDSDEDYGPETNIDTVDVLVSPKKCMNPFSNNTWKEGEDCDDLIDYPKPDDLNMDKAINFSENMNNLLKENIESQSVEEEAMSGPLDDMHMNQMNASNLVNISTPEGQNITFANYGFANKEFIDDANFDKEIEKSADIGADHSFGIEKQEFVAVSNFSDFENFENKANTDFEASPQKNIEHDADKDLMDAKDEVLCNGNAEVHGNEKTDLEKLIISTLPSEPETNSQYENMIEDTVASDTNMLKQPNEYTLETNAEPVQFSKEEEDLPISSIEKLDLITPASIETNLNIPHSPSDSENTSQKEPETPELLSPTSLPLDEKLKDDIVADSGGEAESEDEGWKYIKGGSGAPTAEEVGLVFSPEPSLETDKPTMNSPLNPNAAEFVPVSPVPNPSEAELQKTPIRNTPVGDIIASSPNWNNMDCVDMPDEVAFMKEIRSRPSNIFLENDLPGNDLDGLGCNDLKLDNKDVEPDLYHNNVTTESPSSENFVPQMEQFVSQSPVHGIALASDMTSSFIDPSTMSSDNDVPKQEPELIEPEKEVLIPEIHTTLNIDAAEFKFEPAAATGVENKLLDLSPLPVEEEIKQAVDATVLANPPETNILDLDRPMSPIAKSGSILEKTPDVETPADSTAEILDLQPEKVEIAEVPKVEAVPVVPDVVAPITPEPISKVETEDVPPTSAEVSGATAASVAVAAATTVAVGSAVAAKKDETKKVTGTPKTSTATSKVMKSAASPKTPPSSAKNLTSAKKPASTTLTKPAAAKPLTNSVSSPATAKPAISRVSSASPKTATTKAITSTTTPRPLARRTTPTASTTTTKTTASSAKSLASKPLTAPAKTAAAPRAATTAAAPKPKPRVPSTLTEKKVSTTIDNESKTKRTEVLTKKPGIGSSTVTTTTRTTTSRPASAPIRSVTKTTSTVTTTRTTTAKPRTSLTGITSTTTTTTRTVLNSKKPLSATSKDVGSKPITKTAAKVNGLANGNANKTKKTTVTSTTASKTNIGDKTETKAENILDESIDTVENQVIENNKDINLINGISHD